MPSGENRYILAIDLGTSGPKVGLVSVQGKVLEYEFEPTEFKLLPGGGAEQDPHDWWRAIVIATRRLLSRHAERVKEVIAIACTGQWSGTVAVGRGGDPLMNAIIWMDTRGAPYAKKLTSQGISIGGYSPGRLLSWIRITGGIPTGAGKDPIAHILFIKKNFPEVYQATYKFLEPIDYLGFRLTGETAASFDSIALHWLTDNRDIQNVRYHPKLLDWAEIEREKLPELRGFVDMLGRITPQAARELGLQDGVEVVMAAPDVHSAAVGSGAVEDYQAHIYIGTSSWMVFHMPGKKTNLSLNMASLPAAIPGKYIVIGEQECAGMCLTYLRDNVFFADDELPTGEKPANAYAVFDRIVANAPAGSQGVIFTPWLYGERAPVEDHLVRGGFFNQSLKTTRSHLLRAVYEGVAYNSRWLLGNMEKFTGQRLDSIRMVGGGAKSSIWCQIYADVFDRTVMQVGDPICANMLGAGLLACVALGYMKVGDIPSKVEIAKTFKPNSDNRKVYDELFSEFVQVYHRLKPIYARLNEAEN
jgi:xylulokinase